MTEKTNLFGFDEAIGRLKRGAKLQRKGWNGKNQYIELAFSNLFNAINNMVTRTRLNQLEERIQQLTSALAEKEE